MCHCFHSLFFLLFRQPRTSTLFPYTTLFRSGPQAARDAASTLGATPAGPKRSRKAHFGGADVDTPVYQRRELAKDQAIKRSEEHTSELQSRQYLVCRLLLEKKKCRPSSRCRT